MLDKIMLIEEQNQTALIRARQYQKNAVILEEDLEYQNCLNEQIKKKNQDIIKQLQIKSAEIIEETNKIEQVELLSRKKQIEIKGINQKITTLYFTLEQQDNQLTHFCDSIQNGLIQQDNLIHDMQFSKDKLTLMKKNIQNKKKMLSEQEQSNENLQNNIEDLQFQLRRTKMQLQTEQKGIDTQYWKIQTQRARLKQNQQYLEDLKDYIEDLLEKNQLLQTNLEEQIIQDFTLKKIVDSKMEQPIGKKMKKTMQSYFNSGEDSKYSQRLEQTCSTFKASSKKDNLNFYSNISAFKQNEKDYKQNSIGYKQNATGHTKDAAGYKQNNNSTSNISYKCKSSCLSRQKREQMQFMSIPLNTRLNNLFAEIDKNKNLRISQNKDRQLLEEQDIQYKTTDFSYRKQQKSTRQMYEEAELGY